MPFITKCMTPTFSASNTTEERLCNLSKLFEFYMLFCETDTEGSAQDGGGGYISLKYRTLVS